MPLPRVAVVVATRDRPAFVGALLEHLVPALRPCDELVVVDSASRDDAVRRTAEAAGVRVVRCDRPGVSRARNAGVAATTAPLIAMTDDDCLPEPGWTERVEAAFDAPDVGFVTGRVVADRQVAQVLSVIDDGVARRFDAAADPATVGHGANMAWRRVAFEAIGGFDEVLGPGARLRYAEEHDAFWRALRAGWRGRYHPDAVVVHRQWRDRREFLRVKYGYGYGSGAFAGKITRLDPREGRRLFVDAVWRKGLRQAWVDLRAGYETGAAGALVKAAGAVAGVVNGLSTPLRDGHFTR